MSKIAITTDSNSGILIDEGKSKDLFVLPMPFLVNGEMYFEGVNLSQEQFYKLLETDASVSTSQPSRGELSEFWNQILKDYDEIVHLPMSSGLSQSCAAAQTLAKEFDGRVHVVDNRRISVTLKQSVYDAVRLKELGNSAAEIVEYLERTADHSSIYIAVDTMKYLKKGGRVTPAAATIGTILRVKPVLQIHGATLDKHTLTRNGAKAKEAMKTAIAKDLRERFSTFVENDEMALFVAHTNDETNAKALAKELQASFPNIPVHYCDPLSLSVSCHIGPGSLAIACARFVK